VDAAVRWSRDSITISRQRLGAFASLREYHQSKNTFHAKPRRGAEGAKQLEAFLV
jgi:hypothetical protein